jgi:hypothetical protein
MGKRNRQIVDCGLAVCVRGCMALLLFLPSLGFAEVLTLLRPAPADPVEDPLMMVMQADSPDQGHVLDIDFQLLTAGVISTGSLLRVEPEPGVVFTAAVRRVGRDVNDVLGITASLTAQPEGLFIVSVDRDIALGEVILPAQGRRYQIVYDADALRHIARDVAESDVDYLPSGVDLIPEITDSGLGAAGEVTGTMHTMAEPIITGDPLEEVTINLMIVYTPAAASWASQNAGGINNVINQAMSRAQTALDNSNTYIELSLQHSAQVTYTESGASLTDLTRIRLPADGYMDEIHGWRYAHGADIVSLFTRTEDTGGLGYQLNTSSGFPAYAFNLVRVQQAAISYTLIHETGHNMGAGHHLLQTTQPGPGLYSYSAGWRWSSGGTWYNSIMAYNGGNYYTGSAPGAGITSSPQPYFSSPDVTHSGQPTGHATQGDNARTLRETKHVTANYRNTLSPPDGVNMSFRAIALDNRVMLRWTQPTTVGFASDLVHIRFSTNGYPATTSEGQQVYQGTDQHVLHASSTPGVPHYYTIWVSNDGSTFITP